MDCFDFIVAPSNDLHIEQNIFPDHSNIENSSLTENSRVHINEYEVRHITKLPSFRHSAIQKASLDTFGAKIGQPLKVENNNFKKLIDLVSKCVLNANL